MKKLYSLWDGLTKRRRDTIIYSTTIIGFISSLITISGISLADCECLDLCSRIWIMFAVYIATIILVYWSLGKWIKDSVKLVIHQTPVTVCYGDIFQASAWRVIGCDTHFDTRVDDTVISKGSLHGQLVLNHGKAKEISDVVEKEAKRLGLKKNSGLYEFPLGTIIRYESSVDGETYLLLAMTELNHKYESHTNMAKHVQMLMKMWEEISRVYAGHDIAIPLLGNGITRLDDRPKEKENLLSCMLWTLNISGVSLNSKVEILLHENEKDIEDGKRVSLYEYKGLF